MGRQHKEKYIDRTERGGGRHCANVAQAWGNLTKVTVETNNEGLRGPDCRDGRRGGDGEGAAKKNTHLKTI